LAQSVQLLQPRRPLARARRSRRAAAFFWETMARSAKSKGLGYLFLGLLGAALSHELASAFAGAPSPRESAREAAVSMAGGPKDGIFTPMVQGAKVIVGEQQLKDIRAQVIKLHGELMANFIDTANSPSGDFALEQLFKAADTDGSGKLDKEELKVALQKLGFSWMGDEKVEKVAAKGDKDDDGLIDLDEFKQMAPTVLRQNLLKLAKENGAELGFLS